MLRSSQELRPGLPIGLVVYQALRVKRSSVPSYTEDDYLQDVMVKLMSCTAWSHTRGPASVFVRVVARSVLRDHARREARRGWGVKPTPPPPG
jgi:DNA-directed RNA polymerase specialized sigma24 family protein